MSSPSQACATARVVSFAKQTRWAACCRKHLAICLRGRSFENRIEIQANYGVAGGPQSMSSQALEADGWASFFVSGQPISTWARRYTSDISRFLRNVGLVWQWKLRWQKKVVSWVHTDSCMSHRFMYVFLHWHPGACCADTACSVIFWPK